jgi:hypothetical protein
MCVSSLFHGIKQPVSEAGLSTSHLVSTLRMRGAIPLILRTPSCRVEGTNCLCSGHSSVLVSHPKKFWCCFFGFQTNQHLELTAVTVYTVYTRCSKLFSHASWFYFEKASRKGLVETYFQLGKNCFNLLNSIFRFFSSFAIPQIGPKLPHSSGL